MRRVRSVAAVLAAAIVASACSASPPPAATRPRAAHGATPRPSSSSTADAPTGAVGGRLRVRARTAPWQLPYPVAREALIRRGAHAVLAGGLLPGDLSTDRVLSLDLRSGRARADPPLGVPVHDTGGTYLDQRLLVVGGGNAVEQAGVQARPLHGTRWTTVAQLPQPRSDLSVLRVGGQVVVLGGYDGRTTAVPSILASTDGDRWRLFGTLAVPVRYAAAVADGSSIYVLGGERDGTMQRAVQRVDPDGHTTVVARLPVALGHAAAVRLAGRILVLGGRLDATHVTDRMWWFDPADRRFSPAGRLPTPLADFAVAAGRRVAYLVGGETPTETDRVVVVTLDPT